MTQYNFISNEPCGQDLFAGKSHESTAKQIAKLLSTSKKSLMIGLEGDWGSGKSNLIELVEKELNVSKENAIPFFTYDAWGHQNDLTRRSILEELTYYICDDKHQNIILKSDKNKEWKNKLKNLLSKRREIRTVDIPKFSTGLLILIFVVIFTPIFSSIADSLTSRAYMWPKVILKFLPLFFFIIYITYQYLKNNGRSLKEIFEEIFYIYKNKTKENITYEEIFLEEPSSKEFKDWMKDLDNDLQRKLVIVFDNMDRLPAYEVQGFWASIHSFFSEINYNNIRVIVPFDRDHILTAFNNGTKNINDRKNSEMNFYADDFINKTFDVVYRVAPPTMSNWKEYLTSKWEEAFREKLPHENPITQIFDLLSNSKSPRNIISFINECVVIKNNKELEVPDEYIALFVVGKNAINQSPYNELLNLLFCKPLAYKYKNEQTSKYLSAIYFQLPVEKAIDLVYTDQLHRELESGKHDLLVKLDNNKLQNILLEKAISQILNVQNATKALAESGLSINTIFWDQLLLKAQTKDHGINLEQYQIELLKHTSPNMAKDHLERMIKFMYNEVRLGQDESNTNWQTQQIYVDAVKLYEHTESLIKNLSDCEYLSPLDFLIKTHTTPAKYLDFIQKAKHEYSQYLVECPNDELDKYLAQLPISELNTLTAIPFINKELPNYKEFLQHSIATVETQFDANALLNRWIELETPLSDLPEDSYIEEWFSESDKGSAFYYYLLLIRIAKGGSYHGEELVPDHIEEDKIKFIVSHVESFISYGNLLLLYEDMNKLPVYIDIVHFMIKNKIGNTNLTLPAKKILSKYKELSETFNVEMIDLLNDWDRWDQDQWQNTSDETDFNIPTTFFEESKSIIQIEFVKFWHDKAFSYLLNFIDEKSWIESFKGANYNYQLLLALGQDIPKAYEAFKRIIAQELTEQTLIISNEIYNSLFIFFNKLSKIWSSVFENIRDKYSSEGNPITVELFTRYGAEIIKKGDIKSVPTSLRTILPTSLLKNEATLSIIIDNIGEIASILKQVKTRYVSEFIEEVKSVNKQKKDVTLTKLINSLDTQEDQRT